MHCETVAIEIGMAKHHRRAYILHMNVVCKFVSTNMATARDLSMYSWQISSRTGQNKYVGLTFLIEMQRIKMMTNVCTGPETCAKGKPLEVGLCAPCFHCSIMPISHQQGCLAEKMKDGRRNEKRAFMSDGRTDDEVDVSEDAVK